MYLLREFHMTDTRMQSFWVLLFLILRCSLWICLFYSWWNLIIANLIDLRVVVSPRVMTWVMCLDNTGECELRISIWSEFLNRLDILVVDVIELISVVYYQGNTRGYCLMTVRMKGVISIYIYQSNYICVQSMNFNNILSLMSIITMFSLSNENNLFRH